MTNGLTPNYDDDNTITVLNARTCNARNTSGCGQTPAATVTVPGALFNQDTNIIAVMALDATTHTLYVGDAHDGPRINGQHGHLQCDEHEWMQPDTDDDGKRRCDHDRPAHHSVYVTDIDDHTVSVFNSATCNSTDQSGCSQFTSFAAPRPAISAVDSATHTLYVPDDSGDATLGYTAVIDGSTCNGTVRSGCGYAAPRPGRKSVLFKVSSIRRQEPFTSISQDSSFNFGYQHRDLQRTESVWLSAERSRVSYRS